MASRQKRLAEDKRTTCRGRAGHRECHIGGDFLLIYKVGLETGEIIFVRTGTHADLFN